MDGFTGSGYADTAGSADTDAAPAPQKGRNRMVSRVHTVAFNGVDVLDIDCQVQLSSGMVAFNVVGLPDKAVAESRERVRAALAAMGLALPPKRIAVNLAPAVRDVQAARFAALADRDFADPAVTVNAEADGDLLDAIATPDADGTKLLTDAAERLHLSARAWHRIRRVARTIADLDGSDGVRRVHVAEALGYRRVAPGR